MAGQVGIFLPTDLICRLPFLRQLVLSKPPIGLPGAGFPWNLNVLGASDCFLGNQVKTFAPIFLVTVGAGADFLTILDASTLDTEDR